MQKYIYKSAQLKDAGVKYILSIGKRQPMHLGHKRSLERILSMDGFKLVYVIGSTNKGGDPLFDPFVNPLNLEQQMEQFRVCFPKSEVIFLPIKDVADMSKWGPSILDSLKKLGIDSKECAIHFIGKPEDKLINPSSFNLINGDLVTLNEGQWLIEAMAYYGFTIWFDEELPVNLSISARNLRKLDLENLNPEHNLAAPEYLLKIAKIARENNPDKFKMLNKPITLEDLSLERIRLEK
jgi:hypothetical protein